MTPTKTAGLYLHVPFCTKKCPYCHFYKELWDKDAESQFVTAICQEIKAYYDRFGKISVPTIFFGGGTPNVLRTTSLETIYKALHQYFDLSSCVEQTMEINPGLSAVNKLKDIKSLGINRISVGTQSFNDQELELLGRQHRAESNLRCIESINAAGFDNFSLDIMYGLPHSTLESLSKTIQISLSLNPSHLSTYALSIEPDTPFKRQGVQPVSDEIEIDQYQHIIQEAGAAGFAQYEISNFAKPGQESKHNLRYWNCEDVIGLGPGAHSFFQEARYKNARSLSLYIKNPEPRAFTLKKWPVHSEKIRLENYLICQLRLIKPLDIVALDQKFKLSFLRDYASKLDQLKSLDLITLSDTEFTVKPKGRQLLNTILELLL